MIRKAMFQTPAGKGMVQCRLCNHGCLVRQGEFGICGVRSNIDGGLFTHAYGQTAAVNIDPIEKKPLTHFLPKTMTCSFGTRGCNFSCEFCQNWQLSMASKNSGNAETWEKKYLPEEIVTHALESGCSSISYTYNEPTAFFEYAYDTARAAGEKRLANVFVTNGFMTEEALRTIEPHLDACNADLKSMRSSFYRKLCHARLEPVLDNIRYLSDSDIWLELTTLIIPGFNDSDRELAELAEFIADMDPEVPWHISRFHPDCRMTDIEKTPEETLGRACTLGKEAGLSHIYIHNLRGTDSDTLCPDCGFSLIRRQGRLIPENRIENLRCPKCGSRIAGIWNMKKDHYCSETEEEIRNFNFG